METRTLRRIDVGSAAKVVGLLYAFLAFIIGILVALFAVAGLSLGHDASLFETLAIGVGAPVFLPIFYGIASAIVTAITAALYNLVARWVGGISVVLEP